MEQKKTNENSEANKIKEEELEAVSGGSGDGEKCFFQNQGLDANAKFYEKEGADPSFIWLKCASYSGVGCWGCACHGRGHCVDCYHKVDATSKELLPANFANHGSKLKSNSYNTQ